MIVFGFYALLQLNLVGLEVKLNKKSIIKLIKYFTLTLVKRVAIFFSNDTPVDCCLVDFVFLSCGDAKATRFLQSEEERVFAVLVFEFFRNFVE